MKKKSPKRPPPETGYVRHTLEEIRRRPTHFDRARFDAITDKDIERQIASDPDVAPDMTTLPTSWQTKPPLKNYKPQQWESPTGIRRKLRMTQEKISDLLHISVGTWRNWEQGRSRPYGPAAALLHVLNENPKAVLKALGTMQY